MTARQEAHALIDSMPEDSVQVLIPVMAKLIPFQKKQHEHVEKPENSLSPKMQAFLDMQEMRKNSVKYDFSEVQREAAMNEKYGVIR